MYYAHLDVDDGIVTIIAKTKLHRKNPAIFSYTHGTKHRLPAISHFKYVSKVVSTTTL